MNIELVYKEVTGWFGRTRKMYAIRRGDGRHKDLIYTDRDLMIVYRTVLEHVDMMCQRAITEYSVLDKHLLKELVHDTLKKGVESDV